MHGLITLIKDNHVDSYLKEILEVVYYGSIVNNWIRDGMELRCPKTCVNIVVWRSIQSTMEADSENLD